LATEVKPKSNRILLIFGVFLAIVAFGGALLVGKTSGGTGSVVGGSKTVDVVVATKDIAASTQITADLVTISKFSEDQTPPFAFHSKDLVIGKYAAIPIHANSAIIDYFIVSDAGSVQPAKQAFLPIPSGMVAMQIPTGELVGVGGYIQPDDRIDVITTANVCPVDGNQQPITAKCKSETKSTFTNLHIIRVGPAGGTNTRGISSSLTVVVTLKQAEDLKFLLDNTNYKFVLKSVKDYDQVDPTTTATTDISFTATYQFR
jgi:pilus assembly protein CpaB